MRCSSALSAFVLGSVLLVAAPAAAGSDFIEWSSTAAGSGGGVSATVTSTVTTGSFFTSTVSASDPNFVAEFAASYSVLFYRSAPGGPGAITSTYTFSPALPVGARLIAVDLDFAAETFTLSSGGTALTLLTQQETMAGETSSFPSYNPGTGVLAMTGGTNEAEASVFDVSGLSTIDVDFAGGSTNSGSFVAIALPFSTPVPALGLVGKLALMLGLMCVAVRRR